MINNNKLIFAMALSLLATIATVSIQNPSVVRKDAVGFNGFATLTPGQLAAREEAYARSVRAATKLEAEATLAKETAVHEKQSLDRFRARQEKEHTAYVHKTAAYLEIKQAAKEARRAKEERAAADEATKIYRAKKREAQQATIKATALEQKSKRDKAAALHEVKLAAKTGLTMHSSKPGLHEGQRQPAESTTQAAHRTFETSHNTVLRPATSWGEADEEFEAMAKPSPASSKDVAQEVVSAIFNGAGSDQR